MKTFWKVRAQFGPTELDKSASSQHAGQGFEIKQVMDERWVRKKYVWGEDGKKLKIWK